jgi:Fe-S cluster biogenesis protein NfuA/nitrite reductase/ring-hydroxylating ferredoxin subunit
VADAAARERIARLEGLLESVEGMVDPGARETATEAVAAVVDLYGEGLARVVAAIAERDDGALAGEFGEDELVSHLLLLHGLHPVPVEARVRGALDEVRPYLESHGGDVELLGVEDGVVRLGLQGSCNGCPSSTATLKLAIEEAILKAAPDVASIEADGAAAPPPPAPLLQIGMADGLPMAAPPAPLQPAANRAGAAWTDAGPKPELGGGGPRLAQVGGEELLFVEAGGSLYAYRPPCPACHDGLGEASLDGNALACPGCGNRYAVRRAGRGVDDPDVQLEPVPLLVDDAGQVKVALGTAV